MYLSSRSLTAAVRRAGGGDARRAVEPGDGDGWSAGTSLDVAPPPAGLDNLDALDDGAGPEATGPGGVGRNVWSLGLTSMFTDVSSEMVAAVLPLYLTTLYGFSPLQFGLFDGLYQGMAAVIALGTAFLADRGRRHKEAAAAGYSLSAVCTAGLLPAQGLWAPTLALLYLSRLGKGIRTAPRDALISLSATRARLGRAFGIHRAFDTVGAVAGPVLASLLLARDPAGFGAVFGVGVLVAVVGLAVLVLFVQPAPSAPWPSSPSSAPEATPPPLAPTAPGRRAAPPRRARRRRPMGPHFRRILLAAAGLAALAPGQAVLFLVYQRHAALDATWFPLLFSASSVVFLVAAVPVGRLADRVGRVPVFLAGQLALAAVLAVLAFGGQGPAWLVALVVFLGAYYAATDGVLVAMAAAVLPVDRRTAGLALLATALALGHWLASSVFGAVWDTRGGSTAASAFLVGVLGATALGALALRGERPGAPAGSRS